MVGWFILSAMTKLLQKAFERLAKLPDEEQNAYASILLEEIDANGLWLKAVGDSPDVLEALADEALEDHKAGKTTPLDFDSASAKE